MDLKESYKSLNEALVHGGIANDVPGDAEVRRQPGGRVEGAHALLGDVDAVLVPGGFGVRGTEGKIAAVRYAREQKVPFFGICLGLQMAVVEFARDVLGLANANSVEFDERTPHPVITLMESQRQIVRTRAARCGSGRMRCVLKSGSLAARLYGKDQVSERHRHRYEVNNAYRSRLSEAAWW